MKKMYAKNKAISHTPFSLTNVLGLAALARENIQKIARITPFSNSGLTDNCTTFCRTNVSYLKRYRDATSKTKYFVAAFGFSHFII